MKYKVGDRVKVKSLQWFNQNSDDYYNVVLAGGWYFSKPMSILCGKELTIKKISHVTNPPYYMMTDNMFAWTDEMIEGLVEESLDNDMKEHQRMCDEIMDIQGIEPIEAEMEQIIHCPEGYIFKDENGNVINATKIVLEKKKKEYPKTYEECCEIMNVIMETEIVADAYSERLDDYELNLDTKIENLRKLLICRDAYWKIAGEEMGLGKPWEPDFSSHEEKFSISVFDRRIVCIVNQYDNIILTFPTREMRDAFYENFEVEIKSCKELL